MLGRVKKFIRKSLDNDRHPAIHSWFRARDERRTRESYERHQRMTYAEIEAEIARGYEASFKRKLDWDNPQTFNEKIKVAMLYMPTPLKTRLADKYLVCEWVKEKIGSKYLIPLLGVYDSFDEIDFDKLPSRFVIKCNHDSGSTTIVTDKSKINYEALKSKYDKTLNTNYAWFACEMHYLNIKPKIIIEDFIENADVNDYRFFCFAGKPYYCAVDFHDDKHKICARNFYSLTWERMPFALNYPNYPEDAPCPENLDTMIKIATTLSEGIDQVRVDLYSSRGEIFFGEMTFTHAGGTQKFMPDEWDYKLGALWPFDNSIRRKVLAKHSRP